MPQLRWSMVTIAITFISCTLHKGQLKNSNKFSKTYNLLIAFFVLTFVVSLNGVSVNAGLDRCYSLFTYLILVYLIVKSVSTKDQLIVLLTAIVVLGGALGVEAYSTPRHGVRLEGVGPSDANDSNNLALLLASVLPLGIPAFLLAKNKIVKLLLIVCAAFICNGIILANSRGAVLALGVGCLALVVFCRSWQIRWRLLLLMTVGIIGFIYLSDDAFFNRFQTVADTKVDRGAGRLDIWTYGVQMAKEYPFGTGADGFKRLSPNYLPDLLMSNSGERVPHNTYLLVLIEQGIAGLVLFLFVIYSCIRNLVNIIKKTADDCLSSYYISVGLFGCFVVHLFGSIFGDRLYYEFFYVLISMVILTVRFAENLSGSTRPAI